MQIQRRDNSWWFYNKFLLKIRLPSPISLETPVDHTESRPPRCCLSPGGKVGSPATKGILGRGHDHITKGQAPVVSHESNVLSLFQFLNRPKNLLSFQTDPLREERTCKPMFRRHRIFLYPLFSSYQLFGKWYIMGGSCPSR